MTSASATLTSGPVADARADLVDDHDALVTEVARIRALLGRWAAATRDATSGTATAEPPPTAGQPEPPDDGPLARLAEVFAMSAFERDVVALCAAVELDGGVAALVANAAADSAPAGPWPTAALAAAALPGAHWDAFAPASPLRFWHVVEMDGAAPLGDRPLRIDERILHGLTGGAVVDERLAGVVRAVRPPTPAPLTPSQAAVVDDLSVMLAGVEPPLRAVVDGDDEPARRAVAMQLASSVSGIALVVNAGALPPPGPDLALTARLLDRETLLTGGVAVVVSHDADGPAASGGPAAELDELLTAGLVVHCGPGAPTDGERSTVRRTVPWPSPAEQLDRWQEVLEPAGWGDDPDALTDAATEVSQHYRLGAGSIDAIGREVVAAAVPKSDPEAAAHFLRSTCRRYGRVDLDGLAERIEARSRWDDLVLPDGQIDLLRDVARQVRHRHRVHVEWGFAGPTGRGLGVTALFAGESGTGKSLAAEVLAADLDLDLYRVDLSATVSKWIGETEKNLRRVFDAAERSGAVLLFDEADALFSKRGEVKDSHDRYANLEVAYLLGRMESYRGLALLTTNLRGNVDRAFLRRLRFVVQFPFPDERQRARIWACHLPDDAPTKGLDTAALARLNVAGGGIRSIALAAAFAAADEGSPITPLHVLRAAEVEYAKAERTMTDHERAALR